MNADVTAFQILVTIVAVGVALILTMVLHDIIEWFEKNILLIGRRLASLIW